MFLPFLSVALLYVTLPYGSSFNFQAEQSAVVAARRHALTRVGGGVLASEAPRAPVDTVGGNNKNSNSSITSNGDNNSSSVAPSLPLSVLSDPLSYLPLPPDSKVGVLVLVSDAVVGAVLSVKLLWRWYCWGCCCCRGWRCRCRGWRWCYLDYRYHCCWCLLVVAFVLLLVLLCALMALLLLLATLVFAVAPCVLKMAVLELESKFIFS